MPSFASRVTALVFLALPASLAALLPANTGIDWRPTAAALTAQCDAGIAYRTMILEPGGIREPDELLRAFLGRGLSYDAFYRNLGITIKR
jgi:hypothetical protein